MLTLFFFLIWQVISIYGSIHREKKKQACYTNRSLSWTLEAPHIYYINREVSVTRNLIMQTQLGKFGYDYTRINAITPKDLIKTKEFPLNDSAIANVMAATSSHLQSIYTALREYKIKKKSNYIHNSEYKKSVHYALIMEDDPSFVFDIRDWKGLVESAPTDWSILQLTTINAEILKMSFETTWIKSRKLWEQRTHTMVWSAAAYLINMDSPVIDYFFGNPTDNEKASFNIRFDNTKLFSRNCNQNDLSMASRLGCKAFWKKDHLISEYVFPPDYFIYYLADPYTFFSTIPLLGFADNLASTLNMNNEKQQNDGLRIIRDIAQEAVKMGGLPSYLSASLCPLPNLKRFKAPATNLGVFESYRTRKQECYSNRSLSWSKEAPHVYYINHQEGSVRRNLAMQKQLREFGYEYTRINGVSKDLTKGKEKLVNQSPKIFSNTLSHLQSIYVAVRDYRKNVWNDRKSVHYALIMEDDPSFVFDIRDWKGLVESAPTDWSILQLTTINADLLTKSFETAWVGSREKKRSRKQWVHRTNMMVWSAAAYLINMDSPIIRKYFGHPTYDERASFNIRFDDKKLFNRECNQSDVSMSSRLGCKVFWRKDHLMFDYIIPPDYFIYYLSDPYTYYSTIPLLRFADNLGSNVRYSHESQQSIGTITIQETAQKAVKMDNLPSYLSSSLCALPS